MKQGPLFLYGLQGNNQLLPGLAGVSILRRKWLVLILKYKYSSPRLFGWCSGKITYNAGNSHTSCANFCFREWFIFIYFCQIYLLTFKSLILEENSLLQEYQKGQTFQVLIGYCLILCSIYPMKFLFCFHQAAGLSKVARIYSWWSSTMLLHC